MSTIYVDAATSTGIHSASHPFLITYIHANPYAQAYAQAQAHTQMAICIEQNKMNMKIKACDVSYAEPLSNDQLATRSTARVRAA